jgi:hypothetical protein
MVEAVRNTDPVQITRANVADALGKYLRRKKLTVREFNEQILHVSPRNVVAYNWLAMRGLPSAQYIPLLARTLGKPQRFFEVHAEPEAPAPTPAPTPPPTTNGNGSGEPSGVAGAAAQAAVDALDELFDGAAAAAPGAPQSSVVHAREPRVILRERNQLVPARQVAEILDGPAKNSLTYWSNGDGTATVTMLYTADRIAAQRVFAALAELSVDAQKKDEA